MAQILKDGNDEELTFSDLAKAAVKLTSVNRPTRRNELLPTKPGVGHRSRFTDPESHRAVANLSGFGD